MSMCDDDSDILFLKFENRCQCKGCPAQIRRAIASFDGVRETRSVDYDRGFAELVVSSEIARKPQRLCDWIMREARKHAYVDRAYNTSSYFHKDCTRERKEEVVYREHTDRQVHVTRYY